MRKLLLATSALLGSSVAIAGVGYAGTLTPNAPNPAPGSITVTLNALIEAFVFDSTSSGLHSPSPAGIYGGKYQAYGESQYARLYPSFDGKLANGLIYGGAIEIRQYSGTQTGSNEAATLFVQREYVYLGADKVGKIYLGNQVQPTELFQTGNATGFDTGGFDGDVNSTFRPGLPYLIDDSNDRSEKVVYVSPQFAGFDFAASFEPNDNEIEDQPGNNGIDRASSVPTASPFYGHRRNTVDGTARYQGAFGPIGVKAEVGGSFGGAVQADDGGPHVKNFSLLAGGLEVTFGGLLVEGHIDTGVYGNGLSSVTQGRSTAFIGGASYTMGPAVVGASLYGFSSGYTRTVSGDGTHGYGLNVGGTYTLAPGATLFVEYLYGHQRANGYDLVTGGNDFANNNTRMQALGIGTALKW
jgi:hypothetical protein